MGRKSKNRKSACGFFANTPPHKESSLCGDPGFAAAGKSRSGSKAEPGAGFLSY